jgi:hypothetical protein
MDYRAGYERLCVPAINGDATLRREGNASRFWRSAPLRRIQSGRSSPASVARQGPVLRLMKVERARRSAALDDNSYAQAVDRLRERWGPGWAHNGHPTTDLLTRARGR